MNLNPKRKIQLSVLAFIVIFFLVVIFGFRSFVVTIKNNSESLASQKASLALLEKQIESVQTFQKNYLENKKALDNLNGSFLNYFAPVEFFEFLEEESANMGVLLDASPLPETLEKEKTAFKTMNFEVIIAGNFSDCLRFLKRIESGPFLSQTAELSVEKVTKNMERFKQFESLRSGQTIFVINLKVLAQEKNAE